MVLKRGNLSLKDGYLVFIRSIILLKSLVNLTSNSNENKARTKICQFIVIRLELMRVEKGSRILTTNVTNTKLVLIFKTPNKLIVIKDGRIVVKRNET
jgi:hypothetical protein